MYVCVCLGVTDHQIIKAIDAGHQDFEAIKENTGAGGCCGACVTFVEDILAEKLKSLPLLILPSLPELSDVHEPSHDLRSSVLPPNATPPKLSLNALSGKISEKLLLDKSLTKKPKEGVSLEPTGNKSDSASLMMAWKK